MQKSSTRSIARSRSADKHHTDRIAGSDMSGYYCVGIDRDSGAHLIQLDSAETKLAEPKSRIYAKHLYDLVCTEPYGCLSVKQMYYTGNSVKRFETQIKHGLEGLKSTIHTSPVTLIRIYNGDEIFCDVKFCLTCNEKMGLDIRFHEPMLDLEKCFTRLEFKKVRTNLDYELIHRVNAFTKTQWSVQNRRGEILMKRTPVEHKSIGDQITSEKHPVRMLVQKAISRSAVISKSPEVSKVPEEVFVNQESVITVTEDTVPGE